jgi:hyperosmotically inducible protein
MKIQIARGLAGLAVLAASAGALTGCNKNETAQPQSQTVGQYVDDKTLSARVQTALSENPDYKFDGVKVDVSGGTVQLSGFVNTSDQKNKAADIAKATPGAKDVENKISLKPAP